MECQQNLLPSTNVDMRNWKVRLRKPEPPRPRLLRQTARHPEQAGSPDFSENLHSEPPFLQLKSLQIQYVLLDQH